MNDTETVIEKKPRTRRRVQQGQVTSISGAKTIQVVVNKLVKHSRYDKYIKRRTKLAVHDESNQAQLGDQVEIVSCRPFSKRKAHRLVRIVRQGG